MSLHKVKSLLVISKENIKSVHRTPNGLRDTKINENLLLKHNLKFSNI